MEEILAEICIKHGLTWVADLELGYNSDRIWKAADSSGKEVVIKTASSKRAREELSMNNEGYIKLRAIGLLNFIPHIYAYEQSESCDYMVMEYLGPNFRDLIRGSQEPKLTYHLFLASLMGVYATSRQESDLGREAIEKFILLTVNLYVEFVQPVTDKSRDLIPDLSNLTAAIQPETIKYCSFSNWDFTPEDVYLTPSGVRYSDPHSDVLGIPIIEMACFAGLIRLYDFPEAEFAYALFEDFAVTKISLLLHISPEKAQKIFYLGRLFQCFMSIRFRHEKSPEQAAQIFEEATALLKAII